METARLALHEINADESFNARLEYNAERLEELTADIRKNGMYNPLIVRKNAKTGKYDLISGFTRLKALHAIEKEAKAKSKEDGKTHVPVTAFVQIADAAEMDDTTAMLTNLKENMLRQNLTPYEVAKKAHFISRKSDMTAAQIGNQLGKGAGHISNLIRIIEKVHPDIQEEWRKGHPSATTDYLLKLATKDKDEQWAAWEAKTGAAEEEGDEDAEEGEGEGDGEEVRKPKKPSLKKLEAAIDAVNATKGKSDDWKAGAVAALRFAAAQRPTIPGVYNPKAKPKKGKGGDEAAAN